MPEPRDVPPGNDPGLEERLRLLLSWRHQARLLRESSPGDAELDEQLWKAEKSLRRLRDEKRGDLDAMAAGLRKGLEQQQELVERIASGKIGAPEANEGNRRITAETETAREGIKRYNKLLSARNPNDVGGFVELPIGDYAVRLAALPRSRSTSSSPLDALSTQDRVALAAAALVAAAALMAVFYFTQWGAGVRFSASLRPGEPAAIVLECRNHSPRPIRLHLPWERPEGATDTDYGVDVYVADLEEGEFRFFRGGNEMWRFRGAAMGKRESLEIGPGLSEQVEMRLAGLRTLDTPVGAVRLVCSRGGGVEVDTFRVDLP